LELHSANTITSCRDRDRTVIVTLILFTPFLRYGDLLAENCEFFLPLSHLVPRSLGSLWNFAVMLAKRKLESWGYPIVKTA